MYSNMFVQGSETGGHFCGSTFLFEVVEVTTCRANLSYGFVLCSVLDT